MKILYVANHGCGGNQDEEAIHYALQSLGHEVVKVNEGKSRDASNVKADFLLFHKWSHFNAIRACKLPRVFWYFDLITCTDPSLSARNRARESWMEAMVPLVDVGFCTDGDWVRRYNCCPSDQAGKLITLRQGADERVLQQRSPQPNKCSILFTGICKGGGLGRETFVEDLKTRYGDSFLHIPSGCYREQFASTVATYKIVVAPDFPVTDLYWSNRVYNTLGAGGFLLHPYCKGLALHYRDGCDLVYYYDRVDLFDKIDYYLTKPDERETIRQGGYETTFKEHLYRHRCEELIRTVKERLRI